MPVGKKSPLKTIELAVKRDKLVTDKPSKSKQPEVARIEFRAGGGLHGPEKPRCSASGIGKQPENKKPPWRKQQQPRSHKPPGGWLEGVIQYQELLQSPQKPTRNLKLPRIITKSSKAYQTITREKLSKKANLPTKK